MQARDGVRATSRKISHAGIRHSRRSHRRQRMSLHEVRKGIVKLTDCRLFSAFLHEAKPLKLPKAALAIYGDFGVNPVNLTKPVVCRMRTDERTRAYVARRTLEGLSKREIMRCLKRYVAREIYRVLTAPSSA